MNSRHNTTSHQTKNRKEKLVLVRESVLYGLVIERAKEDKVSINRGIVSTPNVIFYSNNTKCLIDYTNQTNSNVEEKINEYFSQVPAGATLTFNNGYYSDPNSNLVANLSGSYKFKTFYNGVIEADVLSVNSLSSSINRYDKTRFENIPYMIASNINDGTIVKTIIKNKFGKNTKNSFNYMGIKVGDYIKLTDMTSAVKVEKINIDSDGNEYLVLNTIIQEQDLTSKKTKAELYIMVSDDFNITPDITETTVGTCFEISNRAIISCTDNNTRSQCIFRINTFNSITTQFTPNTFCSTPETDRSIQKDTTESLLQITNALASNLGNINNSITGPVLRGGSSQNSFYGRSF